MGQKTLRDIIKEDEKLRTFNLIKKDKYDKSTWEFIITDERSPYSGVVDLMREYRYQTITMRHNDHFFLVYKIYMKEGEEPEYLVDIKKANQEIYELIQENNETAKVFKI